MALQKILCIISAPLCPKYTLYGQNGNYLVMPMKKITVLVPAYNEEDVLEKLHARLGQVLDNLENYSFEILFVNDGSKDKTLDIIKALQKQDSRISYVDLSRNYGKEIAMIAGLDHARGDAVVIIDADLQDPPELIPEMIRYWKPAMMMSMPSGEAAPGKPG